MSQVTQLIENQTTAKSHEPTKDVEKVTRRPVPAPGRVVGFEEALQITLKEDSELLRRLAQ